MSAYWCGGCHREFEERDDFAWHPCQPGLGIDRGLLRGVCEGEDDPEDGPCGEPAVRRFRSRDSEAVVKCCDEHYPMPEGEWDLLPGPGPPPVAGSSATGEP